MTRQASRRRSHGRRGLAVLLIAAGLAALSGCKRNPPPPPNRVEVTVAVPTTLHFTRTLETTGSIASPDAIDLVARVSGTLEQIARPDGAEVHKGDLLFVIEPLPYLSKLQAAQAAEAQQQAASRQAEAEYQRQLALSRSKVVSQSTLDQALATRDADRALLAQAQSNTQQAAITYGYTRVFAPFDGVLSAHVANVGQLVGASGPTTLASLVSLDPVWVNFSLPEADVIRIRASLDAQGRNARSLRDVPVEVTLATEPGQVYRGVLDYAAPQVDSATGTLAVRGVLPNPRRVLLPGYFVRVRLPVAAGLTRLAVPDAAIGSDQDGPSVLVVDAAGRVEARAVQPAELRDGLRVIEHGLEPDDRVVVGGRALAAPGDLVATRPAEQAAAGGGR